MNAQRTKVPTSVEEATCYLDGSGQVRCDFGAPKRSRVVNPKPNGKPSGLAPGCAVNLATGKWACPGLPMDGRDAKVHRVFNDQTGHQWAEAGPDRVVVPTVRSVSVGALRHSSPPVHDRPQPSTHPPGPSPRSQTMNQQQLQAAYAAQTQNPASVGAPIGFPGFVPPGTPGCAPPPAFGPGLQGCATDSRCEVPLGIQFKVDNRGNIYPLSATQATLAAGGSVYNSFPRTGNFILSGLKFFNGPGEAELTKITSGDQDSNYINSGAVDVAAWNTVDCWCFAPFGCMSVTSPLRLCARAITDDDSELITVRGAAFGTHVQNLYGCGPSPQCAVPGMPY